MPVQRPFPIRGLYAVTPESVDRAQLLAFAKQALAGGAVLLQYRDKGADSAERLARAAELRQLCSAAGVPLIVNDAVDLALAVGADGVDQGADDGDPAAARSRLGDGAIVGVSCYASLERAERALAAGADYLAFGAAFASPTKPAAVPVSLPTIAEACRRFPARVAVIGGITAENAVPLVAAGVSLLAVITDLCAAPDLMARARQYQSLFTGSGHDHA